MANEAKIVEFHGPNSDGGLRMRTVASNAAISFGMLLQLTDENTASIMSGAAQPFGGIAAMEKVNNDYSTKMTVFTDVVADLVASGAITVGAQVTGSSTGSLNYISQSVGYNVTTASLAAMFIGIAEGTAADNERIRVRVK